MDVVDARALWRAAELAGADAVTTRGLVDRELARLVEDRLSGSRRSRRIRLSSEKDFAGRLGYVGGLPETPAGPIAVYHVGGRLYAVADACPHAGASLCEGELEGDVITCPRHGSQFRVTDGARVRGPADAGLSWQPDPPKLTSDMSGRSWSVARQVARSAAAASPAGVVILDLRSTRAPQRPPAPP